MVGMPAQEFGSGGWRPCSGVQERNANFASGKCAIENREVTHDDSQEAESCTGFQRAKSARDLSVGCDISKTKCEEVCSAYVEIREVAVLTGGIVEWVSERVVDERITEDHTACPDDEKEYQGK